MRQHLLPIFVILAFFQFSSFLGAGVSQVEFTARITSVDLTNEGAVVLMQLTPDFSIPVHLRKDSSVREGNSFDVPPETLLPGMTAKVEGVFIATGILARELEITDRAHEFELQGALESINAGNRQLMLHGFEILLLDSTEVQDPFRRTLGLEDLRSGDSVRVEGTVSGAELIAREVYLQRPEMEFAGISIEGNVVSKSSDEILVDLGGGVLSLVETSSETTFDGLANTGDRIGVTGFINSRLAVSALSIESRTILDLVPDEVRLQPGQTATVNIVLDRPFPETVEIQIVSQNPSLAMPSVQNTTIPAGGTSTSFQVEAGGFEGVAFVDVTLLAGDFVEADQLKVEVQQDGVQDEAELEIKWNPDKIEQPSLGVRQVQLNLNMPAPSDLTVQLFVKEGDASMVSFPSTVLFAEGTTTQNLTVEILKLTGRVKVRAALPAGGDTDDLEIDFREQEAEKFEVEWSPDKIEASPEASLSAALFLEPPPAGPVTVQILLKDGNPNLVTGMPAQVTFDAGEQQKTFQLQSTGQTGKVRFTARVTSQSGEDEDDLDIEIE